MSNKKPRHTKADVIVRLDRAEALLSQGLRSKDVINTLREEYNVVERTARKYIYKALQRWESESELSDLRNSRRIEMRTELWNLYEMARKSDKYKDCVAILDRICKLDGLYEAERLDISLNQGVMVVPQVSTSETDWMQSNVLPQEDNKKLPN